MTENDARVLVEAIKALMDARVEWDRMGNREYRSERQSDQATDELVAVLMKRV